MSTNGRRQQQAMQLKEEGNALFRQKDYEGSIQKFSNAIALDDRNPVFYANRAASYYFVSRYQDVINDCHRAIQLDPRYVKPWLRKADAHDALTQYAESIEAYERALPLAGPSDYPELKRRIETVTSKIMNRSTMGLSLLLALARAHNISIPNIEKIQTPEQIETLRRALYRHPKWGTQPRVRFLFIPDDEKQPIRNIELERAPFQKYEADIKRMIACEGRVYHTELLHSDEQAAVYGKGLRYGVPLAQVHCTYEAYMDSAANRLRAPNRRASALLCRPNVHGPVLVMKTYFIKSRPDRDVRPTDIVGWETLNVDELRGAEFQRKRREFGIIRERHAEEMRAQGALGVSIDQLLAQQ